MNGTLAVHNVYFVEPQGSADDILLDKGFAGQAIIGPGDLFAVNPGGSPVRDATSYPKSGVEIFDPLAESDIGSLQSNVYFYNTANGARLHFHDPNTGGADYYLGSFGGALSVQDQSGSPILSVSAGGIGSSRDTKVGQHLNTTDLSTDLAGTVVLSDAPSGAHMFVIHFNNDPVCIVTPTSTITGLAWWSYNTTQDGLYIFASRPTTATFKYICVGAPN